jgi:biotin synthase
LYDYADTVTQRFFGKKIYFRGVSLFNLHHARMWHLSSLQCRGFAGIVEFSNVCTKDCYYCGIRKHIQVKRYAATGWEIASESCSI